ATNRAAITVTRTGGAASGVSVRFETSGGSATTNVDYTAVETNLTFNAGESNKTVFVPILPDGVTESNETVNLKLSNPT
ncbi:hypothetical protein NL322_28730, partial [Klebsiella pneumoniae]|nr:hypothetical protein [Klebsiella pneumoniae]